MRAPHPFLVLAFEAARPLALGVRYSLRGVDRVVVGRGETRSSVRREVDVDGRRVAELRLAIPARAMSSTHATLTRTAGAWLVEDAASRNGTRVNGERVTRFPLRDGDIVELGGAFFLLRTSWPSDPSREGDLEGSDLARLPPVLRTMSPSRAHEAEELRNIARTALPVVALGETGTGKELVARAVHELSGRAGAFVAVNCAALPATLVETQLFGHVRGAFSGAVKDEPGFVRASHGGTLLLDEIGDLPLPAQAALLRVLQESEVVPVGATRPIAVDIRVVAATHRSLDALVAAGTFRSDLLARLSGFRMTLPPLRERREDLGLILRELLTRVAPERASALSLAPRTARALALASWPHNVRQLEHVLARLVARSEDGVLRPEHLPPELQLAAEGGDAPPLATALSAPPARPALDPAAEAQRAALVVQLEQHRGNVAAVARVMAKAPIQIRRWMKYWDIDPDTFRK